MYEKKGYSSCSERDSYGEKKCCEGVDLECYGCNPHLLSIGIVSIILTKYNISVITLNEIMLNLPQRGVSSNLSMFRMNGAATASATRLVFCSTTVAMII